MNEQQPQQTIEAQFTIAGMMPAERGLYAIYARGDGTRWRTPVVAWGAWEVRQTTKDRFDTPKVQVQRQSGPLVHTLEAGMCPAVFVTGLPSLQRENHQYLGIAMEGAPYDPLWAPALIGKVTTSQPATALD